MRVSMKTALAVTALFALLCAGCSGGSAPANNTPTNNTPSGTIQGSAK